MDNQAKITETISWLDYEYNNLCNFGYFEC